MNIKLPKFENFTFSLGSVTRTASWRRRSASLTDGSDLSRASSRTGEASIQADSDQRVVVESH